MMFVAILSAVYRKTMNRRKGERAVNRKIWKALGIVVCMLALAAPHAMAETNYALCLKRLVLILPKWLKRLTHSSDDDENEIDL